MLDALNETHRGHRKRWPLWTCEPSAWWSREEHPLERWHWSPSYLLYRATLSKKWRKQAQSEDKKERLEERRETPLFRRHLRVSSTLLAVDFVGGHPGTVFPELPATPRMPTEIREGLGENAAHLAAERALEFLAATSAALQARRSGRGTSTQVMEETEELKSLAFKFCLDAGLVTRTESGPLTSFKKRTLQILMYEAASVIEEIDKWTPSKELQGHLGKILEVDPDASPLLLEERRAEQRERLLIYLSFPFLTYAECAEALSNRLSAKGRPQPVTRALALLRRRMPGHLQSIRNYLKGWKDVQPPPYD